MTKTYKMRENLIANFKILIFYKKRTEEMSDFRVL